jgi:hypothetical protein
VTASSRIAPPGWTTTAMPASAAASTPSGNGKNASLAATPPAARPAAFWAASAVLSTRFCWPAPMPQAAPPFTNTMAFDFTWPHTRHARSMSPHRSSGGWALVTTRQSARPLTKRCGSCTRNPPPIWRRWRAGASGGAASSTRVFLRLAASRSTTPGA